MEFPADVLLVIKAYALPVTRSQWREGSATGVIIKKHFGPYTNFDIDSMSFSDPVITVGRHRGWPYVMVPGNFML